MKNIRLALFAGIAQLTLGLPLAHSYLVTSYNFTTTGDTGVIATGSFSVYDNRVEVAFSELSGTEGYITGFWFYNPQDVDGQFTDFVTPVGIDNFSKSSFWSYSNPLPNNMSNVSGSRDLADFTGAAANLSGPGGPTVRGIAESDTPTFTFWFNGAYTLDAWSLYPDTNVPGPDMAFRWMSVGEDNEDSDKTIYVFTNFEIPPIEIIPEPSTVGLIAVAALGFIPVVRRLRRKKA
jgi:hypothetical protein